MIGLSQQDILNNILTISDKEAYSQTDIHEVLTNWSVIKEHADSGVKNFIAGIIGDMVEQHCL